MSIDIKITRNLRIILVQTDNILLSSFDYTSKIKDLQKKDSDPGN